MSTFPRKIRNWMKKSIIIGVLILLSNSCLYSQNTEIRGRVIDNHLLKALGYVEIFIQDTVLVGRTDLNGYFRIGVPISETRLKFMSVGMETAVIEITSQCDEVEIVMMYRGTYDFTTPRKIDRLRMKEFNELPRLHREAFGKGIFVTEKACYVQQFMPRYPRK
jgi:hypothetical protein